MIYFDSSYVVRLYYRDRGFEAVRQLSATDTVACAQHGQAEVIAAFHRKFRETSLTKHQYRVVLQQFADDITAGAFVWLPLSHSLFDRLHSVFNGLSGTVFLRSADAMHLSAAAEGGFREVYSNDSNLLASAEHFGLRGRNVIP